MPWVALRVLSLVLSRGFLFSGRLWHSGVTQSGPGVLAFELSPQSYTETVKLLNPKQ